MDFMVHGSPTPRNYDRNTPRSARNRPSSGRPPSAKPTTVRNPITGVETPIYETQIQTETTETRPQSRPQGVPALNLNCFMKDDKPVVPIEIGDYPLDTPGTASTVSWGTPAGSARSYRPSSRTNDRTARNRPPSGRSSRPEGVPGLSLGFGDEHMRTKPLSPKQPSAWDKQPVPEDLPPPSSDYQMLYKQYKEDLKHNYQAHTNQTKVTKDDVNREVAAIKSSYLKPKTYGEIRREVEKEYHGSSEEDNDEEEDYLDDKWTKKQSYSTNQMLKKMDAEELLEYNKKQKMIETVLVDQLSRAVISDPEQDNRPPIKQGDTRRGRGSHRHLHDSKVRTHTSATENLLSRRVRFGARLLTRNGHDAMRELTGFYFEADNTLTIYEFRQFGKSAKALPFIARGRYCHLHGPRKNQPYSLIDICMGSDIIVLSEGQHTLPETLKKLDKIFFRVTNVDEEEKQKLMLEDVRTSAREKVYTQLHLQNKKEVQTKMIMSEIQDEVRKKLKKRGIRTVTGLGRYYRKEDTSGRGVLYRYALEKGLFQYRIDLSSEKLDFIFETLDTEEKGEFDYSRYMFGVIGQMNEFRKLFVLKAFKKIDSGKRGKITLNEIKKFFNASFRPAVNTGETPGVGALQAFIEAVQASPSQDEVSFVEFEEYYEGLSISVDDDSDFATILHNTWNI